MQIAVERRYYDIIRTLVKHGESPDKVFHRHFIVLYESLIPDHNSSPLTYAVELKDTKLIQFLLDLGADINKQIDYYDSIHYSYLIKNMYI